MGKKNRRNIFKGAYDRLTKMKTGITLGRPIAHNPKLANNSQMHYLVQRMLREGYEMDERDLWRPIGSSIVAGARNMIIDNFLEHDGVKLPLHHYLLFIDDDQCFPEGYDPYIGVKQLLDDDKDIVGAMTVRRYAPYRPNISIFKDGSMRHIGKWPEDKPFCVHQLGFGMVLIKREVILRMRNMTNPPAPLFYNPLEFNPMTGLVELRGEDYRFCINAMKLGYDIWVDPRVPLNHIGDYDFGIDSYKAHLPELEKEGGLIDLCQDTNLYAELAEKLRKSNAGSQTGPTDLYDAAGVEKPLKEATKESKLTPEPDGTLVK